MAQRPTQVATAMQLLWPTVEQLSHHDPLYLLDPTIQAYRELLERLPAAAAGLAQAQQALRSLAGQLLKAGRVRCAKAALEAMPPHDAEALAAMLWPLVEAGWPGSTAVTVLARH